MWILPSGGPVTGAGLTDPRLVVPAHYDALDRQRLLEILRWLLPDVSRHVVLAADTVEAARRLGVVLPGGLLFVHSLPAAVELEAFFDRLEAFGARYTLVQAPTPRMVGLAWMQRALKLPLVEALRADFQQADHPLAALQLGDAPVDDLAGCAQDPVEMLALLELAIEHRLVHADIELTPRAWERSLDHAVFTRLRERTRKTPGWRPPSEALLRSLAARREATPEESEMFHDLSAVGLGHLVEGEFWPGAMVLAIRRPGVWRRFTELSPRAHDPDTLRSLAHVALEVPLAVVPMPEVAIEQAMALVARAGLLKEGLAGRVARLVVRLMRSSPSAAPVVAGGPVEVDDEVGLVLAVLNTAPSETTPPEARVRRALASLVRGTWAENSYDEKNAEDLVAVARAIGAEDAGPPIARALLVREAILLARSRVTVDDLRLALGLLDEARPETRREPDLELLVDLARACVRLTTSEHPEEMLGEAERILQLSTGRYASAERCAHLLVEAVRVYCEEPERAPRVTHEPPTWGGNESLLAPWRALQAGRPQEARALVEQGTEGFDEVSVHAGLAASLVGGFVAWVSGRDAAPEAPGWWIRRRVAGPLKQVFPLELQALMRAVRGDLDRAARLYLDAHAHYAELGDVLRVRNIETCLRGLGLDPTA